MNQRKKLPELSQTEWIIMKMVWELKKTNVREVYEELKSSRDWAYNTVRTMMERLRDKGYLEGKKVGNMYFYLPRVARRKVTVAALDRFVHRVFDGAIGPVVSRLIEQDKLSPTEIKEIKRLLDKREKS